MSTKIFVSFFSIKYFYGVSGMNSENQNIKNSLVILV